MEADFSGLKFKYVHAYGPNGRGCILVEFKAECDDGQFQYEERWFPDVLIRGIENPLENLKEIIVRALNVQPDYSKNVGISSGPLKRMNNPQKKEDWKWHGHVGHHPGGHLCRFHLYTEIGPYRISTIGEMCTNPSTTEMEELVPGYYYQTKVFEFDGTFDEICGCLSEHNMETLSVDYYNDAKSATYGHYAMCEKWSDPEFLGKREAMNNGTV